MLNHKRIWPSKHSVHFLHNWRCAGSTINSILSSNYNDRYLKVGHPFNIFGWPHDYNNHPSPLLSLGHIRQIIKSSAPNSVIVGGHTFLGLESFLPGSFDIWMNYRDPLQRLNSGILRFYNKQYASQPGNSHLIDVSQNLKSSGLDFPDFVDRLLTSTLKRESNGIARRLSSLSLATNILINDKTNVETVDFLTSGYSDKDLYEASLSNLTQLKILINSSYVQASLLCIEHFYDLSSPLINPFSNLSHNPVTLSGVTLNDKSVINVCKDILVKHSAVDLKLLPYLHNKFAQQVNCSEIDDKQIAVRDAIHAEQLFNPKWFVAEKLSSKDIIRLLADSLENRCRQYPILEDDILKTILRWNGFSHDLRDCINKYLTDKYSRPVIV